MSRGDYGARRLLDFEELGRAVEVLFKVTLTLEGASSDALLSPYVATQGYVAPLVAQLSAVLAEARSRSRQPIYYEPGCGEAEVASRVAASGAHVVCLELDSKLAERARDRMRGNPNADVVIGDLSAFRIRRVDVAYAYLLPTAVRLALCRLSECENNPVIVSLDYPAQGAMGLEDAEVALAGGRTAYVYRARPTEALLCGEGGPKSA